MKNRKKQAERLLCILLGTTLYSLSVQLFLRPGGLLTGGTTGISLAVEKMTGFPAATFMLLFNSLLFLLPSEEAPFLELMVEAKVPLKRISVNPSQTQSITKRLMEEVARDAELNHLAVTAFQSYVRSVYLASNKKLFDVSKLDLEGFAEVEEARGSEE